jgi:hypothetical protein
MSKPQRPGTFTARAIAPMRRRVRALRRLLGSVAAENASFRIERQPGQPAHGETAAEGSS